LYDYTLKAKYPANRYAITIYGLFSSGKYVESALERKQRETPPREVQYDGVFDAHVVALACSEPPSGYQRWTLKLLAEKLVELEIVPRASPMSVHRSLKKINYSLTGKYIGKFRQSKTLLL
jgi:hypothetical protein